MGLFDRFTRRAPADVPFEPKPSSFLSSLIQRYSLEKKTLSDPSISGQWWEGLDGHRLLAFVERGKTLFLYLGEPVEITSIYLVRASSGEPRALGATQQDLERIAGSECNGIARHFRLGASPPGRLFDIPELRLPALCDGLPRLSASVREEMVFENLRGLALTLDDSATIFGVEQDLPIAHAILDALEGR